MGSISGCGEELMNFIKIFFILLLFIISSCSNIQNSIKIDNTPIAENNVDNVFKIVQISAPDSYGAYCDSESFLDKYSGIVIEGVMGDIISKDNKIVADFSVSKYIKGDNLGNDVQIVLHSNVASDHPVFNKGSFYRIYIAVTGSKIKNYNPVCWDKGFRKI